MLPSSVSTRKEARSARRIEVARVEPVGVMLDGRVRLEMILSLLALSSPGTSMPAPLIPTNLRTSRSLIALIRASAVSGPVLVTGATGNVGRQVVRLLLDADQTCAGGCPEPVGRGGCLRGRRRGCRAGLHRPGHVGRGLHRGSTDVPAPTAAPGLAEDADGPLTGARTGARRRADGAAVAAGWRAQPGGAACRSGRVVAPVGSVVDVVRASFFMQDLTTVHVTDIRDRSEIVVPAGGGATAFVDPTTTPTSQRQPCSTRPGTVAGRGH